MVWSKGKNYQFIMYLKQHFSLEGSEFIVEEN
jgi:hypothetical protein